MQPDATSTLTRLTQRANIDLSRWIPRGSLTLGKNTSCSKRWLYSFSTSNCKSSRDPKWANTPDLLMFILSASNPMVRPSRPSWLARSSATSRIAARVSSPLRINLVEVLIRLHPKVTFMWRKEYSAPLEFTPCEKNCERSYYYPLRGESQTLVLEAAFYYCGTATNPARRPAHGWGRGPPAWGLVAEFA